MLDQMPNQNQTPATSPSPSAAPVAPVSAKPLPVQPVAIHHGSPKKGVIISLAIFLLLMGGSASAYFSGAYLKLPFFNKKAEEVIEEKKLDLANMMYERLAQLDGADFELTYALSVTPRDADAEVPDFSKKDNKEKDAAIKRNFAAMPAASLVYKDDNQNSYEGFCNNKIIDGVKESLKEHSFICMEDEYYWAASVELSEGYECIDYTGTWRTTVEPIKSHACEGLEELDISPSISKSEELEFLTGEALEESWMFVEETMPEDISAEIKFTGSGFSLAGRKDAQDLPDVAVGLFGNAKLSSATFDLGIEAKAVSDDFYYKVSDFPIMDITKGHMDEWIKLSPEDGWLANIVPEYDEKQEKSLASFRKFISETQNYNVLSFTQTEETLTMSERQVSIFDVTINAENVPAWLEAARQIAMDAADEKEVAALKLEKKLTPEKEAELVEAIKKAMKNIKISVGLDMEKGDLMMIDMTARFIPPATSKKFADKQFNFIINLKLSNHNNPPAILAPEEYVDQEIIEQEELAMSDEQFKDYKQAQRIKSIREELVKYYKEHREFPTNLALITRLDKDRNTDKPFKYSKSKNNYSLVYKMNTDISGAEEDSNHTPSYDDWGIDRVSDIDLGYGDLEPDPEYLLKNVFSYDYITRDKNLWHDGENMADRFSPVVDQVDRSKKYVEDTAEKDYSDKDVLQAAYQSRLIKSTQTALKTYYTKNKKYPESILDLGDAKEYYFYDNQGFVCEDMSSGGYCAYSLINEGKDYEIKLSFPMAYKDINDNLNLSSYSYETSFVEGENIFTSQIVVDSDKDGLSDRDEEKYGTDKYKYDTDGDGYSDGEEISNGYDPLTK